MCDITNIFANEAGEDIFPHFLLLSFYLFCGIMIFMTAVSLLTRHSTSETPLPTLRQAYRENPGLGRLGYAGWTVLAVLMIGLYVFFQFGMRGR
jgi:SSS family solute:Na+ symporter